MNYGEKLRTLMERASINQTQLAELSGVPQPTISRILRIPDKEPRRETLASLSTFFDISVEWWYADIDLPKDHKTKNPISISAQRLIRELEEMDTSMSEEAFDALFGVLRLVKAQQSRIPVADIAIYDGTKVSVIEAKTAPNDSHVHSADVNADDAFMLANVEAHIERQAQAASKPTSGKKKSQK